MTDYGNDDPRSIYSKEGVKKATTRSPKEILKNIREGNNDRRNKVSD